MARRITVHMTDERGRRETLLAQVPNKAERATQSNLAGPTVRPGQFGDACADNCLHICETYRILDDDSIVDSLLDQWGIVENEELVSDAGLSAAITVQAQAERIDDSTFRLPSKAAWVVDVWFDALHADPTYHYEIDGFRTIRTVTPLPTDIRVTAVYFNLVV